MYFSGYKVEDRSFLVRRYFHLFEWGSNPKNTGKPLSGYRLYRGEDSHRILLKEFDTSTHEYLLSTRGETAVLYELTAKAKNRIADSSMSSLTFLAQALNI
jgi:hypothetical protein